MEKIDDLIPGKIIRNDELATIFRCSTQGGMRKSNKTNSLVIVSNHVESIYDDKWIGKTLYYTGMGTKGDQSFHFMQNKTLFNSRSNGVSVYLFEVFVEKQYTYIGKVALINDPFFEEQPDSNNNLRKVCIFPLEIIGNEIPPIEKDLLEKCAVIKRRRLKKSSDKAVFESAKHGNSTPGQRKVGVNQYQRNEAVIEFAKRLAKGNCQLCKEKAPFKDKEGFPYLETHHIVWLSEGGSDTIENTVALCPNCHKKMHILNDKEDRKYLKDLIEKQINEFGSELN